MPKMTPVNMSVADVRAAAGLGAEAEEPAVPSGDELDNWAQEAYSLSVNAAADLGFPVGNISATFQRDALMFGSSRWKDVVSGDHTYRFGVALRAIVVVSDNKGSTLGGLLPAWQSFGVDSYGQYMTAITGLQKAIMEDAGNIQPELLATTVLSPEVPAPGEAVGTVYALHAVAEGATFAHALDRLGTDDSSVLQAVKALYRSVVGEDDRAIPGPQQRQDAQDQLHGFHISRNWFRG